MTKPSDNLLTSILDQAPIYDSVGSSISQVPKIVVKDKNVISEMVQIIIDAAELENKSSNEQYFR